MPDRPSPTRRKSISNGYQAAGIADVGRSQGPTVLLSCGRPCGCRSVGLGQPGPPRLLLLDGGNGRDWRTDPGWPLGVARFRGSGTNHQQADAGQFQARTRSLWFHAARPAKMFSRRCFPGV